MPIIRPDFRGGRGGSGVTRPDFPGSGEATFSGPTPDWYWKLNDASSGVASTVLASDGVQATVNGVATGATWTTDTIGGVADINVLSMLGAFLSSTVQVTPVFGGVGSSSFTVQQWLKPDAGAVPEDYLWVLDEDEGSFVWAKMENTVGIFPEYTSNEDLVASTVQTVAGTWYHVVCVVDASGPTATWYVNTAGTAFAATGSGTASVLTPNDTTFQFFGLTSGTAAYHGLASEVAIWKSALSAADVESAFNEGTPISLL